MKAGVIYATGDIRYADFPDPSCGADDIIVKVAACGICGSDSPRILSGWKYPLPGVPGHEFSGTVVEIGKNVKNFKAEDKVAVQPFIPCCSCDNCRTGYVSMCDGAQMIGADMPGRILPRTRDECCRSRGCKPNGGSTFGTLCCLSLRRSWH